MSLTIQFQTMLAMIAVGGWLGIALDTYGRFLKRPKRALWILFINDLLFWIVQGLIAFYILLKVNQGEIRFYAFLAILCGFAAYQSMLKGLYLALLERIIFIITRIYRILVRTIFILIIKPIKIVIQLIITLGIMLGTFLLNLIKILWKMIYIPLRGLVVLTWRILPKKWRFFLIQQAGNLRKVKNIIKKWYKKIRS